jgi:hypothetical protein
MRPVIGVLFLEHGYQRNECEGECQGAGLRALRAQVRGKR